MRTLLLTASFPPALGGVETLLYQTSRRRAQPPLVVAPSPAAAPDLRVNGVKTGLAARLAYRPLWALHPSLHFLQKLLPAASRAAREWHPEVIEAGHIYVAPLAKVLARRLNVPYVVYAYGQEVWRNPTRAYGVALLDALLRGKMLRAADRVLVPGTFTARLLNDWRVPSAHIVSVPYGAAPQPPTRPPSGCTLLSVARLVPRKGIDTVIRGMHVLPGAVTYRIVGAGPDAARLRQLANALSVADRVTFLGRLDDAALADEYRRCALFVLPARSTPDGELEGYGLVYFEAAAWGRPVLAGRSGGEVDAVEDGRTGVLVDGTSVEAVSTAIRTLLADRERLQALGAAGRKRVETTHNWTCAANVIDTALADLS